MMVSLVKHLDLKDKSDYQLLLDLVIFSPDMFPYLMKSINETLNSNELVLDLLISLYHDSDSEYLQFMCLKLVSKLAPKVKDQLIMK
jgi:hypothetical protein